MFTLKPLVLAIAVATPAFAQNAVESEDQSATQSPAQSAAMAAQLEEVEVLGIRQAEMNAREQERDKEAFSSVISTDDVGNFADQNVAEALRRLPGVSLQRVEGEGKFVSVRGLGPGFVTVNVNGTEMAGAGDDREFSMDAIPADMLGGIEVFKTLTPDMNLNSIGGAVNVKTVSAFDKGKDSLRVKVEAARNEKRGTTTPKISLTGTNLFMDGDLGVGYTVSYEERKNQVDEVRAHSSGEMIFWEQNVGAGNGDVVLGPRQLETRQEQGDRTRAAASFNLEYRNEDSYYYGKFSHTYFEDVDVARREFVDFQDAGSGEIGYANAQTGEFVLSDVDVFQQFFVQEGVNKTTSLSLGGENRLGDGLTLSYEYANSLGTFDKPDGRRAQFRETDLVVIGRGTGDNIYADVISAEQGAALGGFAVSDWSASDIAGVPDDLSTMHLDNIFLENSETEDRVESVQLNLRQDFDDGFVSFVKGGIVLRDRARDRNKDRWSYDPDDGTAGCEGNADCLAVANSYHSDYANETISGSDFMYPFVTRSALEYITKYGRMTRDAATLGEASVDSTKEDYTLDENTRAAYLMGEFRLAPDMSLIAGVRYESTELQSTGYFSIENDDFVFPGESGTLDLALPMEDGSSEYADILPSLHLRYEPTDELLIRAALWTSFTRPSFNQVRAYAKIDDDVELCNPTTGTCDDATTDGSPLSDYVISADNSMQMGNPNLTRMYSKNVDLSVGWYPSADLFLQAALFYKDIDDFIIGVAGAQLAVDDLPVALPIDQITDFQFPGDLVLSDVDLAINGDKARVYGTELSFVQYLPSGFFVQSNLTLMDSSASLDASIRTGAIQLPDQADTTGNLTIGWEDKGLSLRLIGYYRSAILEEIGACGEAADRADPTECKTWSDRYSGAVKTVDFKVQYAVMSGMSVYFDAINLTDHKDVRYFEGNSLSKGHVLYQKEDYGRMYQLGMSYNF